MRTFDETEKYIVPDFKLRDKFGRNINYLRLSITDRCNMRCVYCMPNGMTDLINKNEILTWEEIKRLVNVFVELGITKLRLTGGEPFIRKGILDFIDYTSEIPNLQEVYVTTNGIGIDKFIPRLKQSKLSGINLSVDSLNQDRFLKISQTDSFDKLNNTLNSLIEFNVPFKINTVLNKFTTEDDIVEISNLAKNHKIEVRFIEEMPFDGIRTQVVNHLDYSKFVNLIKSEFHISGIEAKKHSTAKYFIIDNFKGKIGFISGYSRSFCGDCNRIRVTSKGYLKNCLYGENILNLKSLLRDNSYDNIIKNEILNAINKKYKNGFDSQKNSLLRIKESMSAIGG